MKSFFRLFATLLLLLALTSTRGFSAKRQPLATRGTFEIRLGGKKVGTHSYRLFPNAAGFSLTSKTEIRSIVRLLFFEKTQLDTRFSPLSYRVTVVLPYGAQEVRARCFRDSIFLRYRRSLQRPFKKLVLKRKTPLFLLDNNMLDHWEVLLRAVTLQNTAGTTVFALIPQALKIVPVAIQKTGDDTLLVAGKSQSVQKISFRFAGISATGWFDSKSRRLEKLVIPAQNFSMRRLPNFRDFSLSERDSLLQRLEKSPSPKSSAGFLSKEVSFKSDSLLLAGTLTIPKSDAHRRFPAVLFISGSGPVDRDENAQAVHINFFPPLATTLTRGGFVTLRYDKRGVGKSQGHFRQADLDDLVADAAAALHFLTRQPFVDSTRVAIVGHSEGAIIGLILASQRQNLGALVLMAGTARHLDDVVLDQIAYLERLKGTSPEKIAQVLRQQRDFFRKVKSGKLTGVTPQGNADWWREHLAFDPLKAVCRIKVPLLILNGAKDYQVSAEKDARALYRQAKSCGVDATLKIYPNLDHLFKPVQGKSTPKLYFKPGRKISPRVQRDLLTWLREKLK